MGDHDLERIWQRILLAEVTDLGEPRVLKAVVEDINPMLVEDVGWAQDYYHVEEGILVLVDQGRDREGSRQEVKGWGRSQYWFIF